MAELEWRNLPSCPWELAACHAQRDGLVDQEEAVKRGTAHRALGVAAQRRRSRQAGSFSCRFTLQLALL